MKKAKHIALAIVGIIIFPFLFVMVAIQGAAMDSQFEFEESEDFTYKTFQAWKKTFFGEKKG